MNSCQRRKKSRIEQRFAKRMIHRFEESVIGMCRDPAVSKEDIIEGLQGAIDMEKLSRTKP